MSQTLSMQTTASDLRSVIESLSRVGIKRSAMERSTLDPGKARLVFLPSCESTMDVAGEGDGDDDGDGGTRRWGGWQIIFRGAKTLSESADPG